MQTPPQTPSPAPPRRGCPGRGPSQRPQRGQPVYAGRSERRTKRVGQRGDRQVPRRCHSAAVARSGRLHGVIVLRLLRWLRGVARRLLAKDVRRPPLHPHARVQRATASRVQLRPQQRLPCETSVHVAKLPRMAATRLWQCSSAPCSADARTTRLPTPRSSGTGGSAERPPRPCWQIWTLRARAPWRGRSSRSAW